MDLSLLILNNVPIFQQLAIEEALLRADSRNWCIMNEGSPQAIVLGISGKQQELVDIKQAKKKNVLLIKRFSGGGTVIVDQDTIFSSFIFQKETFSFPPYPEHILKWTANFYKDALKLTSFALTENDYTLGEKKCGGNAQYLKKDRWLHHSTFLYDFKKENMDLLLHPAKTPSYRKGRNHMEFLCSLKPHLPDKKAFIDRIEKHLHQLFHVHRYSLEDIQPILKRNYRKTLKTIEL